MMPLTRYGRMTGRDLPDCVCVSEAELEKLEADVKRLRRRTHEIQETADRRNAKLQSEHERYLHDRAWATAQLAAYRKMKGFVWESEFDRLCVLNLRDEWQGEIERLQNALRNVQWQTMSSGPGTSAYPRCMGCGIVSHGVLSTPPHKNDCVIEAALRPKKQAAEPTEEM